VGQTLYFKFLSFNAFNNSLQRLQDVDAVTFVVPGKNPGTVEASSGLILPNAGTLQPALPMAAASPLSQTVVGAGPLAWQNIAIGTR
jgi:hypothetical protein